MPNENEDKDWAIVTSSFACPFRYYCPEDDVYYCCNNDVTCSEENCGIKQEAENA